MLVSEEKRPECVIFLYPVVCLNGSKENKRASHKSQSRASNLALICPIRTITGNKEPLSVRVPHAHTG